MPDLKIRFITESDFVSWAIRWVTFSDFSHVEIELPDGTFLGAHAGKGVQIRPADYCQPSFERRYAIPLSQANYDAAMLYARNSIGTLYDYADIFGLLFRRNLTTKGRMICSRYLFDVLVAGGVRALNILPQYDFKATPDIIHLAPVFIGKCYMQTAVPK